MPREISSHIVSGVDELVKIKAEDAPGLYSIIAEAGAAGVYAVKLKFQEGPASESVNGLTTESLIAVALDRLMVHQRGDLPCRENQEALSHLQQAMAALNRRTRDRADRGVEGTMRE